MPSQLVWVITGTTSGLGRDLALEVLGRGDTVIATGRSRSMHKLDELKIKGADTLELDVTWPLDKLREVAKTAVDMHGRVDIIVNNAGYALVGPIEETTPEDTFNLFNTNLFGALNVSRAFIPFMRENKSGTVVFVGSVTGWVSSPYSSIYGASKWALRGVSASLHEEIAPFGLRSVCADFGYFRTDLLGKNNIQWASEIGQSGNYKEAVKALEDGVKALNGKQPNDPRKGGKIIVDLVRGEGKAAGKPFPSFLAVGLDCYEASKAASQRALRLLDDWKELGDAAAFNVET